MRILELVDSPNIVLNNEESDLLEFLQVHQIVGKRDLNPRQLHLIDSLVQKNLVIRKKIDGNTAYSVSKRI